MRDIPKSVNSNNREYQIYALSDPRDKTIRYGYRTEFCVTVWGRKAQK